MDLRELITRRTVHNFTAQKVDDLLVEQALTLSLWAPNHKLTYPWVYRWLGPQTREQLGALAVQLKTAKAPLTDAGSKAVQESVTTCSHLVALGVRRNVDKPVREREDYATLASGVQIASLVLWAQGIATKWTTSAWATHSKTYTLLGIDSKEIALEGCLMIGYPQITPEAPVRPPLEQFLLRTP